MSPEESTLQALRRAVATAHPEFDSERVERNARCLLGLNAYTSYNGREFSIVNRSSVRDAMHFDRASCQQVSRMIGRNPDESAERFAERQLQAVGSSFDHLLDDPKPNFETEEEMIDWLLE